ncbi:MAG: DEAD/DEAH box helicase [Jaaginema sp. PMC 1079.18]|nr:DEAD/DEAH box helicase [Jaaginema sp. PMC 1080.18]MEC4849624.1 DEAD/DEAH box helicase [Jaaginema sp. PMC 1079.18]MEC4866202.1 DEAD/DEAH box helicase [Jaaginema sp. PMC 1078.18]
MSQYFSQLAPYLQEYIYQQGWTELRPIQQEACRVILETNQHLLLAAGTASGKTEAAFLPILTTLEKSPAQSVGVLYISPIKALINNQFERLSELLKQADLTVWAWHGDISSQRKKKLLSEPQGILQITPESLESLLINHAAELDNLFGNLRFIIIDEMHAFMESQRGSQILCQLSRLSQYFKLPVRRIGLSATLGDYGQAQTWLKAGTDVDVIVPEVADSGRNVRLAVACFEQGETERDRYIFELTKNQKCLIFANNRSETETIISSLRQQAKFENLPDIYHVHHGSISALLREDAEAAMQRDNPAVIAATVTLEMGIDIGQLERVIQMNAPLSVASFLQRLGRTGRRGNPADMRFVCTERGAENDDNLIQRFPWELLQSIAIIQLYLEDRWIEPVESLSYPFSLLYQQTLSLLTAAGELSPSQLAKRVLSLPPFGNITQEDYRQLLHYWLSLEHLQQTPQGNLIIGVKGEKIVRNFRFYAVFPDQKEYQVKGETGEIGRISVVPQLAQQLSLAGRTWRVEEIDEKRRIAWVKPVEGIGDVSWRGTSGVKIHQKILQRMRLVLQEKIEYPYLLEGARSRLQAARNLAQREGLATSQFFGMEADSFYWFPELGTTAFFTLEKVLNLWLKGNLDIRKIKARSPYYFWIQLGQDETLDNFKLQLANILEKDLTIDDLVALNEAPKIQKYDEFIPQDLRQKAWGQDYLDLKTLQTQPWLTCLRSSNQ